MLRRGGTMCDAAAGLRGVFGAVFCAFPFPGRFWFLAGGASFPLGLSWRFDPGVFLVGFWFVWGPGFRVLRLLQVQHCIVKYPVF